MSGQRIVVRPLPEAYMQANCLKRLGKLLKGMRVTHAFVITDAGLVKAGIARQVTDVVEAAGLQATLFGAVVPNPTVSVVQEGARQLRELMAATAAATAAGAGADQKKHKKGRVGVVTLGGGSSMDAGKAIAMLAGQPAASSILDFVISPALAADGESIERKTLMPRRLPDPRGVPPIVAVPTTSGTASETNGAAVITDTTDPTKHRKLILISDSCKAKLILMDAALTVGVPRYPTATCGMDVLTHALEAFTSVQVNPYSDAIAKAAIEIVAKHLRTVVNDPTNLEAREQMHLASHMAGVAFNISGLGICHALGHPLSALFHKAHGQTLATMLPHIMRFNLADCEERYAEVARLFGVHDARKTDEENAVAAVDAIAKLSIDVGTARSIRELGGSEKDIPTLVTQALTDLSMLTTPTMPSAEEVADLYRAALDDAQLYPQQQRARSKL